MVDLPRAGGRAIGGTFGCFGGAAKLLNVDGFAGKKRPFDGTEKAVNLLMETEFACYNR